MNDSLNFGKRKELQKRKGSTPEKATHWANVIEDINTKPFNPQHPPGCATITPWRGY